MGIKNSQAERRRVMDHVFSGTEEFVIRYIDDIVIWADDEMAHDDSLRELHRLAIVGGIYLKSKKGILCKTC